MSLICPYITLLVIEFQDIFEEPTGLPLVRTHDHHIHLQEGFVQVTSRPYRYPQIQNTKIEKQIQHMLVALRKQIKQSLFFSSHFGEENNGGWWLCVNYHQLNRLTIKYKFPIPIIEELLDELLGTTVFIE